MIKKIYISALLLLFNSLAFSHDYNCYLTNITQVDSKNLEFDIVLEWTGANTAKFQYLSAGIIFDYDGIANGGILTGDFVQGSADANLPSGQQSPNWSINQISKQIRLLSAVATPSSVAMILPPAPGFRLGTFRITNTVDFLPGSNPNFIFNFSPGTSTTTVTELSVYAGTSTTGTDVTEQSHHIVDGGVLLDAEYLSVKHSKNTITVFPNPSSKRIIVKGIKGPIKSLSVLNCIGKKTSLAYTFNSQNALLEAEISHLTRGIYFLEVQLNNEKKVLKFVKD